MKRETKRVLEKNNLLKLTQEEIENLNIAITILKN